MIACGNADPEPERRYSIAPRELIAAQKIARQQELEILGFYHSHPDHPAEASDTDLREAHWTGCVYLICGVEKGKLARSRRRAAGWTGNNGQRSRCTLSRRRDEDPVGDMISLRWIVGYLAIFRQVPRIRLTPLSS